MRPTKRTASLALRNVRRPLTPKALGIGMVVSAPAPLRSAERRHQIQAVVPPLVRHRELQTAASPDFSANEGLITGQSKKPLFDKILIANRGEIACRVIKTAKRLGIKTVAVYSEVDHDSIHVRMADEAFCIGPAPSAESYLKMDKIVDVCIRSGAQAVHPGYGFLSENSGFAAKLADNGIVFIGPPVQAIISMGSKSESKDIMTRAGVPCVPGYHGSNQDPSYLQARAEEITFPVLIKAVMGGGGKGMKVVHSRDGFIDALESAKREAKKSFGDERVLVEKYIIRPRHVEVQVFGDTFGNVVGLWERDCSVQRRHQKIIEEAPAPGLSEELRADLIAKAVAAARAVKYEGAGTVEFIFDNDTANFYFMEMNTRLQVEHPVTEMITKQDLVQWQLEVASGNPLPLNQTEIPRIGHAFEARIYAENPRNGFLPDVGPLKFLSTPTVNDQLRVEQGFQQGSNIEVFYDPLISKVVAHGENRTEALKILRNALEEFQVVGLSTNVQFLHSLSGNLDFINGKVETAFIDKHFDALFPPLTSPPVDVVARTAAFIVLKEQQTTPDSSSPWNKLSYRRFGRDTYRRSLTLVTDLGESPATPDVVHVYPSSNSLFDVEVERDGKTTRFSSIFASIQSGTTFTSTVDGHTSTMTIVPQQPSADIPASTALSTTERFHVFHNGMKTVFSIPHPAWLLSIGGDVVNAMKKGIRAPMPSVVVDVKVTVGDMVTKGQAVIVLESMKTETVLRSDRIGKVIRISCKNGEMVPEGKELVEIEEYNEA